MTKRLTIILTMALAAFADMAMSAETKILPAPEDLVRKYECTDKVTYGEIPEPYIFIEVYSLAGLDELDEEARASWQGKLISTVKIDEQAFYGTAYQQGLDYRIDFSPSYMADDDRDDLPYAIIIEKSGNGLRIFASYLYATRRTRRTNIRIETRGGIVAVELHPNEDGEVDRARA